MSSGTHDCAKVIYLSGVSGKKESLLPEGHPIHTLMEEHGLILDFALKLRVAAENFQKAKGAQTIERLMENLDHLADHFKDSEKHYIREENVLFPHIEKHGITGPPAQMWNEHNSIRELKKRLYALSEQEQPADIAKFKKDLMEVATELMDTLGMHFEKENNVLFPMSLRAIPDKDWVEIVEGFDEIGYTIFTPITSRKIPKAMNAKEEGATVKRSPGAALEVSGDRLVFETGSFTREELETILDTLPFDMTFVDADEEVRYFSNSKDRIFPRTKAIIGRKVQNCHPQKSVHVVQKILDDFRSGRREVAEFWINAGEKMVHIRYFALRRNGKFLGTVEVSQDIAPLRKLQGEKRLLD
jgi:hypothetical protein